VRWLSGAHVGGGAVIERFDPEARTVTLNQEAPAMRAGDRFAVFPRWANWQVHHNTFDRCSQPITMDIPGCQNVAIRDNLICPVRRALQPEVISNELDEGRRG
jgi:hypothetical protein